MYRETQWLNVELEENPRDATVMLQLAGVMRNAVLVRLQGFRAWSDIGRGDNM